MDPERRNYILGGLARHERIGDLRASPFFAEVREEIESELATPRILRRADAVPGITRFLRIAQWNIEKGVRLGSVLSTLQSDAVLRLADVLVLNEVDCGMGRSGNADVAAVIASELRMHAVFGAAHFELTRGTGDDLKSPEENRESLQGNAVLSRYPIGAACIVPLPVCFEPFEFHEKRYGRRNCVWARIDTASGPTWIGSTHLEVRNTPGCRARQMAHLIANLPGRRDDRFVIGGDMNSNGFARGTLWRTIRSVSKLVFGHPCKVKLELRHPEQGREPLFRTAESAGFRWDRLNDSEPTADAPLEGMEDAQMLPGSVADFIRSRLEAYGGYLPFKLDWLLGRGVRPAKSGELKDPSGAFSIGAGMVPTNRRGTDRASDHSPIFADIHL
jgi:endonuclease/exonuclease/phosphatase family metal-dependent hydrolase